MAAAAPQKKAETPAVCELYAGVGGFSLGAARAGFHVAGAVEVNARTVAAHKANFPHTQHILKDVSRLSGSELLKEAGLRRGAPFGIIGGPPCQGFSTIGHQNEDDARNSLFLHFFRVVKEAAPWFFVVENVPGLLMERNSRLVAKSVQLVNSSYHVLGPYKISADKCGAPTVRTRVFLVGVHKRKFPVTLSDEDFLPAEDTLLVTVRNALKGLPATINMDWKSNPEGYARLHEVADTGFQKKLVDDIPCGVGSAALIRLLRDNGVVTAHTSTIHSSKLVTRYRELNPGETDPITRSTRLVADGFCPTLRAGTDVDRGSFQAVRPIHYRHPRVITPREAARLQSFPDWFAFDRTKWHAFRQIGNSVPPLLAEHVMSVLYRKLATAPR